MLVFSHKYREFRQERLKELRLFLVHFAEKWGRGISLILSKEPNADFKVVAGIFVTTFERRRVERLSEHERKIIELIKQEKSISKSAMAKKGKLSKKTVEYNIESLKKKGILRRIGGAKGGHWEFNQQSTLND